MQAECERKSAAIYFSIFSSYGMSSCMIMKKSDQPLDSQSCCKSDLEMDEQLVFLSIKFKHLQLIKKHDIL